MSLCGTRLLGTVRNLAEDQLSGEEAVMENYYSSENSYSWEFAMTGMAINTVISFHFRCGVQPKAGAGEASERSYHLPSSPVGLKQVKLPEKNHSAFKGIPSGSRYI